MAVSISISITQNSQSIANNTSNVTVTLKVSWTGGSYNAVVDASGTPQANGWLKIDGKKYTFASTFNTGKKDSGSQTLLSKTVTITHGSDGKKTLACSASYSTYVSSGTVTTPASKVLTTIPRKSTLSVGNGTLGTAQTLTVTRQSTSFTHTIRYTCGMVSGTICSKSSSTSVPFTPDISLASQNTTGTSVSITYTITTYNGSSSVGSNTYTKTCSIPDSVKPSVTIAVSDATEYKNKFGAYVQGLSKFSVTVTATIAHGSPIASYSFVANGATYTKSSFTTDVLKSAGTFYVSGNVKDKRGRIGQGTTSALTVLASSKPAIKKFTATRCNADGTDNVSGAYVKVIFSTAVTDLNSKNTATYSIEYRKSSVSTYTKVSLADYENSLTVTDASYIFEAATSSSYDVRLTAKDAATSTSLAISVPTGSKFMEWHKAGRGISFGKPIERDDAFEVGWRMYSTHGELVTSAFELLDGTDLDDIMDEGYYVIPNTAVSATILNKPPWAVEQNTATAHLEVGRMGESTQKYQRYSICAKTFQMVFQRMYYGNVWSDWIILSGCSTWRNLTIASGFEVYGSGQTPKYRINGNLVTITGAVKPTEVIDSSTTDVKMLGTISASFRPSLPAVFVCQGSGINHWALTVKTDGNIYVSRYGTNAYVDIPVGAWLPFTVTYSI